MTTKEIIQLKQRGLCNDLIYEIAAGNYNLFGAAFFGHKCSKVERAKLNQVWQKIIKTKKHGMA